MNSFDNSLGVYIHIPFCDGKCNYCDFFSVKSNEFELDGYTELLIDKIIYFGSKLADKTVDTIYFGGGTPSILGTERLVKIINSVKSSFNVTSYCEITLEANPTSGIGIDFGILKNAGVNRVSLGMQSSNDNELRLLGRRHSKDDVINTVKSIKAGGIDNISLDVMLGIPAQTAESIKETLDFCIGLDVSHISTYLLSIEPDTVFGKNKSKYYFADDDLQAEFYTQVCEYLTDNGFTHYEISNFCINGKYSRHNMRYWELKDYLGLGPSAHSLLDGKRYYYPRRIEDFKFDNLIFDGEGRTKEEYIMLMLRTSKGVNFEEYKTLFNESLPTEFFDKASIYEKHGLIIKDDNSIKLTEKGFLLSNAVIADLI